jgi:hypothetical protein
VNPRRPPQGFAVDMSRISARTSCGTAGRPVRCRLFHVQNKRKPRRCHATTVSGLTMYTAERQPHHACASPRPQHPVDRRQTKAWASGSMHDRQLVSERDDFQVQRGA